MLLWLSKNQESFLAEIYQLTGPPCSDRGVFLLLAEMHVCLSPGSGKLQSCFLAWSMQLLKATILCIEAPRN